MAADSLVCHACALKQGIGARPEDGLNGMLINYTNEPEPGYADRC
jgi:hypothetical protein